MNKKQRIAELERKVAELEKTVEEQRKRIWDLEFENSHRVPQVWIQSNPDPFQSHIIYDTTPNWYYFPSTTDGRP